MKKVLLILVSMIMSMGVLWGSGSQEAETVDVSSWPGEAITMTCPWGAGGIADIAIRAISEYGEQYFDVPIVPVVRTGAGGAVAITEFLKHKPNAPQLIMASEGVFAITPLTNDVVYKWEDFIPVIGNVTSSFALVTKDGSGLDKVEKLVAQGKKEPLTIAITGNNDLFIGAFCDQAGIDYVAVPYSGAQEQLAAVLSGDVDLGITHPALAKEYVKAGTIAAVTVFDDKPWQDEVYNIPPVTDFGYDVVVPNLNFFMMPAGTDPAIISMVHEKLAAIFQEPDFIALTKKLNLVINPAERPEIEAHVNNAISRAIEYNKIVNGQ
jgi:putative tricarboxylic transport membrane protein